MTSVRKKRKYKKRKTASPIITTGSDTPNIDNSNKKLLDDIDKAIFSKLEGSKGGRTPLAEFKKQSEVTAAALLEEDDAFNYKVNDVSEQDSEENTVRLRIMKVLSVYPDIQIKYNKSLVSKLDKLSEEELKLVENHVNLQVSSKFAGSFIDGFVNSFNGWLERSYGLRGLEEDVANDKTFKQQLYTIVGLKFIDFPIWVKFGILYSVHLFKAIINKIEDDLKRRKEAAITSNVIEKDNKE